MDENLLLALMPPGQRLEALQTKDYLDNRTLQNRLRSMYATELEKKIQDKSNFTSMLMGGAAQQPPQQFMPQPPPQQPQSPQQMPMRPPVPQPAPQQEPQAMENMLQMAEMARAQQKVQALGSHVDKMVGNGATQEQVSAVMTNAGKDPRVQSWMKYVGIEPGTFSVKVDRESRSASYSFIANAKDGQFKTPGGDPLPEGRYKVEYDLMAAQRGEYPFVITPAGKGGGLLSEKNLTKEQLMDVALHDTDPNKRNQAAEIINALQKQDVQLAKQKAESSGITFAPGTLEALATRFGATGEIPGLGLGRAATEARIKILNKWASDLKRTGATPEDQLAKQAAYKASVAELKTLQSQRGKVMAFAETADRNLKNAVRLSDKVDRTGMPIVNRWLLAGKKKLAGDADVSAFDAALRTGINEYAKVVSSATGGGVTSDTARKEVEEMLNAAQTPEQIKKIMQEVLVPDLNNRKFGYDKQIQEIKDSISGKDTSAKPASGGSGASKNMVFNPATGMFEEQ